MKSPVQAIYLSHFLNDKTPGYGGKKDFQISQTKCLSHGDSCNQLIVHMSNHVGTHIDFPFHFDSNGKKLHEYSAQDFIFSQIGFVEVPMKPHQLLTPDLIGDRLNSGTEILIIKTGFESFRDQDHYWNSNPGLSAELAPYLRTRYPNIKAIGFDFISATSFTNKDEGRKAHLSFLNASFGVPILIIEDMHLTFLNTNKLINSIIVSPLLIEGADGAPVTITAFVEDRSV